MDTTLEYYNKNASEFYGGTIDASMDDLYYLFLNYLSENARILDLGCGSGRDSKYFIRNGYTVVALDGSEELCKIASNFIGQEVIHSTFEEIDYFNEFDGIWACASILHVASDKLEYIFQKIARALRTNGYLYVSFKYGNYEGVRNGRYFTDMTEISLSEIIRPITELEIIETTITYDVRKGRDDEKWLNSIIRKKDI